jgi:two-component system sensor histidine kinase CreC
MAPLQAVLLAFAVSREVWLALFGTLFLLGVAATAERILRARRHGYSVRLQIFVPLAATTLALSSSFAAIVIDQMQARAAIFAQRSAEDEARVAAAVVRHALEQTQPGDAAALHRAADDLARAGVLQAFSRGQSNNDTEVQLFDGAGQTLLDVGSVKSNSVLPPRVGLTLVEAETELPGGARVRVRKNTFGMAQLLSDVAPKVALLALIFAVASAVVAGLIGGAIAIPIERLTRASEAVAAGERQAALPEPRGREVRLLTVALESMRRELEERHALEAFVADLSHELKNPIASVRASAEVLEEGAADDPATARKFAARIRESALVLQALTSDLLSLARLEARGLEGERAVLDLRELIQEALRAQGPLAERAKVELKVYGVHEARTRGEQRWLRQAVENLIANALQHAPAGSLVRIELTEAPAGWSIAVSDQGPGVDPSIREKLFTRFATTRHGRGGSGLGLAIVRAVAELHGGHALLRSSSAQGSTFELQLPSA